MKLKKISLKKNQDQLSDSDMKQIRGGAHTSSLCGANGGSSFEYLYTCYTTFPGGTKSTGNVCATDSNNAKAKAMQSLLGSGFEHEEFNKINIKCD
ncbi:TIGR04149 family rSAM-modified RiPP [Bacteroides sp. 519]|uniref:TIGR04149 family rSAM-modified RiPP n=1 Tax=Bacteroides sp. 519 TaxID=2302937 RepID=UPI001EF1F56E|nr:TIGR04149 family rSAM-modified RiPP [Bacteroides sp. 519]